MKKIKFFTLIAALFLSLGVKAQITTSDIKFDGVNATSINGNKATFASKKFSKVTSTATNAHVIIKSGYAITSISAKWTKGSAVIASLEIDGVTKVGGLGGDGSGTWNNLKTNDCLIQIRSSIAWGADVTITELSATFAKLCTVTYNYKYNGRLVSQKVISEVLEGSSYPAATDLPAYAYVKSGMPTGNVSSDGSYDIEIGYNLPFEYAATAAEIAHWYTFKIHTGNNARYVGTANSSTLSFTNTAPGTNPDYLWGFVGNPIDGFQIISIKDRSKGITAADPCTVGTAAGFVVYASKVSNTFCMKAAGQDYLNLQGGNKLTRWNDNDAGSSIVVNEVTIASYTITYVGIEEGDINPNPATYTALDKITLVDPSRDGYNFLCWTPTGVIAKGSTGDKTFTASWELIPTSAEAGEIAWSEKASGDYYYTATPTGKHGTICLPYNCTVEGAYVYEYVGAEKEGDYITGLVFDYIKHDKSQSMAVEAGKAYVYFATADNQTWTKVGDEAADINTENGFTGTYTSISVTNHGYGLFASTDMFHPLGNATIPVFRAYIEDLGGLVAADAPIRAIFPTINNGMATGVEDAECTMHSAKCIVNGRLVIKRGEHMFNLNGAKLK